MDATEKLSFIDLMKVDGVRKSILQYVVKLNDIENLAKTCRYLDLLISEDSIRRDIKWLFDDHYVTINCKPGLDEVYQLPILERINIIKDNRSCKTLEEGSQYYGETVIYKNRIIFNVDLDVGTYIGEEHVSLLQTIAGEFMLNHQLRSDVENLHFRCGCSVQQRSLLLECLSYLNHGSVKRIELPIGILQDCYGLRDRDVRIRDTFQGFPNLNELLFYVPPDRSPYSGSFGNGSTIKYLIKNLAKKRNATVIFSNVHPNNSALVRNVQKIYGFCSRQGVQIKLEFDSGYLDIRQIFKTITGRDNTQFSINNLVTFDAQVIGNSKSFLKCMKTFSSYDNLETLKLSLYYFNIDEDTKDTCMLDLKRYSLRNCRKLKKVTLYYLESSGKSGEYSEKMLGNNLMFFGSLMPDTVERLELFNGYHLSSQITETLSYHMPNIKMLTFYDGAFKDSECLNAFRNLKVFITNGNPIIEIPESIRLFVVGQRYFYSGDQSKNFYRELVKRYSERFLKYLHDTTGKYIFFNDITQWKKYKCVVQNIFN
uniref:F-box domain-containing protein n=1 Tax=Strongyloides papillosus TaxID=174720 RepID=A0A0N5BUN2_STREA